MNKQSALKKIETLKSKVQSLWAELGPDFGTDCQTIGRQLNILQNKIERWKKK